MVSCSPFEVCEEFKYYVFGNSQPDLLLKTDAVKKKQKKKREFDQQDLTRNAQYEVCSEIHVS